MKGRIMKLSVLLPGILCGLLPTQVYANDSIAEKQLKQKTASLTEMSHQYIELQKAHEQLKKELMAARGQIAALEEKNEIFRNPLSLSGVRDWKLIKRIQGAAVYGQDANKTYLGVLDFYGKHKDSVFNPASHYASPQSPYSIWNAKGYFGSQVAVYSISHATTKWAPLLKKQGKVVGYITANPYQKKAIEPDWLQQVQPIIKKYVKN